MRQKAAQVIGYYMNEEQVLDALGHLASTDDAYEVREAASEARSQIERKRRYMGALDD